MANSSLLDLYNVGMSREPVGGDYPKPGHDLIDRMTMLPIGQYEDGSLTLAWPQMLVDMYEGGVRSFEQGRQLPRVDSEGYYAGTPRAEPLDAFNAASAAPVGTIGARATGLTRDVGDLGMFAGRGAKTADHAKLAEAERLASQGAPREQIWNDTGWFQGVDGKWRFEIDDSASSKRWRNSGKLSNVLAHDEMYQAYPELANIRTVTYPQDHLSMAPKAYYDEGKPALLGVFGGRAEEIGFRAPQEGRIGAWLEGNNYAPDNRSSLLHEAQHAIQRREGFANGSGSFDADKYRRTAGETEARAVQKRRNLTPDQRSARAPWLDYDVPEGSQIFANPETASYPSLLLNLEDGQQNPLLGNTGPDVSGYGLRPDGTEKGAGYFGELPRPDGGVSTELSMGVGIDGRETEIPLLVPSLDGNEVNWLLSNEPDPGSIPEPIVKKAYEHALSRISAGQNPFAQGSDLRLPPMTVPSHSMLGNEDVSTSDILRRYGLLSH